MSVILVQPVRVSEAAQATTADVRVAAVPERDEGLCSVSQIPEARTWPGTVPVDKDPSITVTNEIPGRQVVVADQLLAVGDTYDGGRDVSAVSTSSIGSLTQPVLPVPPFPRRQGCTGRDCCGRGTTPTLLLLMAICRGTSTHCRAFGWSY